MDDREDEERVEEEEKEGDDVRMEGVDAGGRR